MRYYNIIEVLTFKTWLSYYTEDYMNDSNKTDRILMLIRLMSNQCIQIER